MKSSINLITSFHSGFEFHIETGAERGRFITLQTRYVKIGRAAGARKAGWVYIDDQTLSSHHVTLIWDSAVRSYRLIHESTTNPTLVNGRSVESAVLKENDAIKMGNVTLRMLRLPANVNTRSTPVWAQLRSSLMSRPDSYQVTLFYQNLAAMLVAGIGLTRCLDALKQEVTDPILRILLDEISTDVPRGSSFSAALRVHLMYFSPIEVALVKAGETTGQLPTMLNRLADARMRADKIRRQVQAGLVYPACVLVAGLVLMVVLSRSIFSTLVPLLLARQASLPPATRFLVWITQSLQEPLVLVSVLVALIAAGLLGGRLVHQARVRDWLDRVTLKVPLFGPLRRNLAASRFCSSLALLYRAGIPIIESVREAAATAGSGVLKQAAEAAAERLVAGETLSFSLAVSGFLPSTVISMIEVGETTGQMDAMLLHVERWLTFEVERVLLMLVGALEPFTVVLLGLFVGFIAIVGFAPAYQVISTM